MLGGDDKRAVASARVGWSYMGGTLTSRVYRDDEVEIVCDQYTPSLLVTKLANNNPVLYIDERGETVRWHGEHVDLKAHVRELVRQAADRPLVEQPLA